MSNASVLTIYTIYEHPRDYPNQYVARPWWIRDDGSLLKSTKVLLADSLDELRGMLPPGLCHMPRTPSDDPCIVECWF